MLCLLHTSEHSTEATWDTVIKEPAHPQVTKESSAICHFAGWQIAEQRQGIGCYINDIMIKFTVGACALATRTACTWI